MRYSAGATELNQRTTHRKPVAVSKPVKPVSAATFFDSVTLRQTIRNFT